MNAGQLVTGEDTAATRAALARLLGSETFHGSPQLAAFRVAPGDRRRSFQVEYTFECACGATIVLDEADLSLPRRWSPGLTFK